MANKHEQSAKLLITRGQVPLPQVGLQFRTVSMMMVPRSWYSANDLTLELTFTVKSNVDT